MVAMLKEFNNMVERLERDGLHPEVRVDGDKGKVYVSWDGTTRARIGFSIKTR